MFVILRFIFVQFTRKKAFSDKLMEDNKQDSEKNFIVVIVLHFRSIYLIQIYEFIINLRFHFNNYFL